jgi:hypothetical protein
MKARRSAVVFTLLLSCLAAEAFAGERGQVRVGIRIVHGCEVRTHGGPGDAPVQVACSSPTPYRLNPAESAPAPRVTLEQDTAPQARVATLTF